MKKRKIFAFCMVVAICVSLMCSSTMAAGIKDDQMESVKCSFDSMDCRSFDAGLAGEIIESTTGNESEDVQEFPDVSDYVECKTTLVPINDTTYYIVTQEDEVIGIYDTDPTAVSRGSWSYSWTVIPGEQRGAVDHVTSYDGFFMDFTMNFSRKGDSSIGVAAHDEKVFYIVFEKNNSFSGRITFTRDMGSVSFAVRNDSSNTITYSGTLSY